MFILSFKQEEIVCASVFSFLTQAQSISVIKKRKKKKKAENYNLLQREVCLSHSHNCLEEGNLFLNVTRSFCFLETGCLASNWQGAPLLITVTHFSEPDQSQLVGNAAERAVLMDVHSAFFPPQELNGHISQLPYRRRRRFSYYFFQQDTTTGTSMREK